ncbi:hypothetical protein [Saccharothrix algeriensis]|uniref:Uncharacterized protein n=1 Tax=Saccharothrix algeriensis TaxID=173560 RepID=A0A8T8HXV7_9PSEU|nr:hypothetical protein [Saccharothrix algeriensis]MBM7814942.1 hypothetical protein [Saccharothrix algeriensis]QTR03209.1 hypothetical protein J7S33_30365 [Saccharothrix algeriensis]
MLGVRGPFPESELCHPLDRAWLHYAFLSSDSAHAVISNLSVLGPERPAASAGGPAGGPAAGREPQRMAILLVHEPDRGWSTSQFNAVQPDRPWSPFRLPHPHHAPGRFPVAARAGAPAVDLQLARTSRPCTSRCAPLGDDRHLRWQSEPGIRGRGALSTPHGKATLDLTGYHERVRGRWDWSALGGWVFGFANAPCDDAAGPPPWSVVFTLLLPERPRDCAGGSVALWRAGRLLRQFPRRGVQVAVHGDLDRDRVTLVPPLAAALGTAPAPPVPRRLLITARMGEDRLVLDFQAFTAARIASPSETTLRPFSVHETLGWCAVEGAVSGREVDFRARGVVEYAGGARDD